MSYDIGKVSSDRSTVSATDGPAKSSGFMRFIGRVVSALKSIGHKELEPVRPLQTRQVEVSSGPLQAPIKLLRQAVQAQDSKQQQDAVELKLAEAKLTAQTEQKELAALKQELHQGLHRVHQSALNEEIVAFDPSTLKSVPEPRDPMVGHKLDVLLEQNQTAMSKLNHDFAMWELKSGGVKPLKPVETVVKDGLQSAKLDYQISGPVDGVALRPQPLKAPTSPAKILTEPQLSDIKERLDLMVSPESMQDYAKQVGERLGKMMKLERKDPAYQALSKEVTQLAKELGVVLGKIYRTESQDRQNAFVIGKGSEFKQQLWDLLKEANPKMPARASGGEQMTSPDRDFLDLVYNSTALQFSNHLGGGSKPTLTFNGSEYEQVKLLGQGGGGMAFLYANKQGDLVVLKSKGFGSDYESSFDAATLEEIGEELKAHLGLMGEDGKGHPNVLLILGVVRTEFGQPSGILELAKHGDLDKVIGKSDRPGTLDLAIKQGLVSKSAEHLLKLHVLKQSIQGMIHVQETKGMRQGDFKPGNLFVQGDGTIKVADFGQTKANLSEVQTNFTGTLDYLPPENYLNYESKTGNITGKADTWAIGIMAHQLFKKAHPFDISKIPGRDVASNKMASLMKPYGLSAQGEREVLSKLADDYDKASEVLGVTALDRFINAFNHPDPEKRPRLSDALMSGVFDDLNGKEKQTSELLAALSANPMDAALVKQKSDALGI